MIRAYLERVIAAQPPRSSALILIPKEDYQMHRTCRILVIPMKRHEVIQIGLAASQHEFAYPQTLVLFLRTLQRLHISIEKAVIDNHIQHKYFSRLYLLHEDTEEETIIPANPAESVSLALMQHAPIYISDKLMDNASFPYIFRKDNEKTVMSEFHEYIQDLKPDDLQDPLDTLMDELQDEDNESEGFNTNVDTTPSDAHVPRFNAQATSSAETHIPNEQKFSSIFEELMHSVTEETPNDPKRKTNTKENIDDFSSYIKNIDSATHDYVQHSEFFHKFPFTDSDSKKTEGSPKKPDHPNNSNENKDNGENPNLPNQKSNSHNDPDKGPKGK